MSPTSKRKQFDDDTNINV